MYEDDQSCLHATSLVVNRLRLALFRAGYESVTGLTLRLTARSPVSDVSYSRFSCQYSLQWRLFSGITLSARVGLMTQCNAYYDFLA